MNITCSISNVLFADLRDDSGLRIFYTPNLRPQEAGTLMVGYMVSLDHVIPPYADYYRTVGYCPGECTGKVIILYLLNNFDIINTVYCIAFEKINKDLDGSTTANFTKIINQNLAMPYSEKKVYHRN